MFKKKTKDIVNELRKRLKDSHTIAAYIFPTRDSHNNKYVALCDDRKGYISGFTGDGICVVTSTDACLWTDSRFFEQAEKELDENWTLMKIGKKGTLQIHNWLMNKLPIGSKVAVDPRHMSHNYWRYLEQKMQHTSILLEPTKRNVVDEVWKDRPARPNNPIVPHPTMYTGKKIFNKLEDIWSAMKKKRASLLVLSALDEICWALNIRGSDYIYEPYFFGFVIITGDSFQLYVNEEKLSEETKAHLEKESMTKFVIKKYSEFYCSLNEQSKNSKGLIWCPGYNSKAITMQIPENKLFLDNSPIKLNKLVKTDAEIKGMKAAAVRCGCAICCMAHWIETELGKSPITELDVVNKLEVFRKQQDKYVGPCVPSTVAFGQHTSIRHFIPGEMYNLPLKKDGLLLIDVGAQYRDGTTAVSRTFHLGEPNPAIQDHFTRVLKSNMGVSRTIFPVKTKGAALDIIARKFLWEAGLDYPYITGHGVGAFLTAHEGPLSIGKNYDPMEPGLESGMFITIEPCYHHPGLSGIRIENLLLTVPMKTPYQFESGSLGFETITMCPIQTKLIAIEMLTNSECKWLNDYHEQCRNSVGALLKEQKRDDVLEWLHNNTKPIVSMYDT